MNLKELYESRDDVRYSQIPDEWKESFNKFIFGSGCYSDFDEDGNVKDFVYYGSDFRAWYFRNKESIERDIKAIERDIKIDKLLK